MDTGRPITVMVRDAPAPELVMEGVDPRVTVLALAGRPGAEAELFEDSEVGPPVLTGLAVYRRNLARFARDAEQFDQQLRYAVLDELASFVGLPDEARERLGLPPIEGEVEGSLAVLPVSEEHEHEPDDVAGKGKRKRSRRRRPRAPN